MSSSNRFLFRVLYIIYIERVKLSYYQGGVFEHILEVQTEPLGVTAAQLFEVGEELLLQEQLHEGAAGGLGLVEVEGDQRLLAFGEDSAEEGFQELSLLGACQVMEDCLSLGVLIVQAEDLSQDLDSRLQAEGLEGGQLFRQRERQTG